MFDVSMAQLDHLAILLDMLEVSALGEIGVDHSAPIKILGLSNREHTEVFGLPINTSTKDLCGQV